MKLNSSRTVGGILIGINIATIVAQSSPVDLFKIAFATQFCKYPNPNHWYSEYSMEVGIKLAGWAESAY